jgi:hypothetical protein
MNKVVLVYTLLSGLSAFLAVLLFMTLYKLRKLRTIKPVPEDLILKAPDPIDDASIRFIPREFLRILNRQTVGELQLGDHVKKDMTIFLFRHPSVYEPFGAPYARRELQVH